MKKVIALVLACVICVGLGIGGTLAWLSDKTNDIVNTFTIGDINIDLHETTGTAYKFVPGDQLAKDPKVTVKANSEACYLFIHVTDANNAIEDDANNNKIIAWAVANDWTPVQGHDGFWYKKVDATTTDKTFTVLTDDIKTDGKDGSVKVSTAVTKDMVKTINESGKNPTITVTAAAVQQDNVADVATAWGKLPTDFTGVTPTP